MLFSCVQERTASRRLKVSLDGRTLEYIAHAMSNGSASESGNRRLTQWPEKQKLEDSYRGDVLQTKPDRGFMGTTRRSREGGGDCGCLLDKQYTTRPAPQVHLR